jgi:DNA polymerase III delta subunit
MASKSRGDIEAAVGQLLDLANNDANNVPVLMALAHGFLLLKQTAKARNQLKVIEGGWQVAVWKAARQQTTSPHIALADWCAV